MKNLHVIHLLEKVKQATKNAAASVADNTEDLQDKKLISDSLKKSVTSEVAHQ